MSIEVRPLGVKCNIQCRYCYQQPQREARNLLHRFDIGKIKEGVERAAEETGQKSFTLFGGEPLLVPLDVLEELWSWGYERFGSNAVQTNGTLISDAHIGLFKRYGVRVGLSVDGPEELNDARWIGSLTKTREATDRTAAAIRRLCSEGIVPQIIVVLSRCNALPEHLDRMNEWFRDLERLGVTKVRLHILEVDSPDTREQLALTTSENIRAFVNFYELQRSLKGLRFDLFREMTDLLTGRDGKATCVWRACDPLTTLAVRGIEGNGQLSNCGRTNKEGIDFVKSDHPGYERYLALYATPQENGGCQGCRFFLMCKGQCPGTAISGDWRNRSEHCEVWKALFCRLEEELIARGDIPLSTIPLRREVEAAMLGHWADGNNPALEKVLAASFSSRACVETRSSRRTSYTLSRH